MAGNWTSERYPLFEKGIKRLTKQHRELEDEPLHLAVTYQPRDRNQQDIYLFEVIGNLHGSIEKNLFEVTFDPPSDFNAGRSKLHLILTSPEELDTAIVEGWPLAKELVGAIHGANHKVLFKDPIGIRVIARLRRAAEPADE